MKRSLGSVLSIAAIVLSAPLFAGCAITQNSDGSVTLQSLTTYDGTPESKSVAYAPGDSLRIVGVNGDITVTSSSSSTVDVTFKPTTKGKGDDAGKKQATDEMNNQIHYAVSSGGEIVVQVTRDSGANAYLGADVVVAIPPSFNGAFTVQQGNGDVDVQLGGGATSVTVKNDGAGDISVAGASGALNISGGFDVKVGVSAWASAGHDGSITAGDLGNISISIPATSNGTLTAQAGGKISDGGLPSNWASAAAADNSKSYTMGDGTGAKVALVAGADIAISN
jgi:hypothetical protein